MTTEKRIIKTKYIPINGVAKEKTYQYDKLPLYYYNKYKQLIIERDKICQKCGSSKKLDVHHKDNNGKHLTKTPNNNPSNLILLCHKCHIQLHCSPSVKHLQIIQRRINGETYQSIAEACGLSRQRIFQIIRNNIGQTT